MPRAKSKLLKHYLPSYAQNPVKLAWRLLTHSDPAARSAVLMAGFGMALSPLDSLSSRAEKRLYDAASPPLLPILLVCGPPRSGTTLVEQFLINRLDTDYINNLTSLFPRSPLTINRLLRRWVYPRSGEYKAFYGKSRGLAGANDGLYLWDRWLGEERDQPTEALLPGAESGMQRFFGAMQMCNDLPVVNKVNRLIGCAQLVAPVLPTARFICLRRNPIMLAQSLLLAREQLAGSLTRRYGLHDGTLPLDDPIEDVCRQVEYLAKQSDLLQSSLGPERSMIVDYEEFCRAPNVLLERIRQQWGDDFKLRQGASPVKPFTVQDKVKLPHKDFERLQQRFPETDPASGIPSQ